MLKKLLTLTICFLFLSSIADAWLAGYGYRKKITIQGTLLDANVTHFPLLIYIVDGDIDDHCDDDGDRSFDIRFTQSDDSVLDVNWEDYSEAGGNATIWAWVSDAGWTIESDGSTEIYLYYGNAAAGDPGTDAGVWDANFKGVWHLNESGDGSDNEFIDSSGEASHGTGGGVAGAGVGAKTPTQIAGKVYKGQDYGAGGGDGDKILRADDATLDVGTGDFSISFWAYWDSTAAQDAQIEKRHESGNESGYLIYRPSGTTLNFYCLLDGTNLSDTVTIATGSWYHCAMTADRDGDLTAYLDGSPSGSATDISGSSAVNLDNDGIFAIGHGIRLGAYTHMGKMDEVRISTTLRSADWIKFEEANIDEGDNELSWEAEEEAPSGFVPKVIIIREENEETIN